MKDVQIVEVNPGNVEKETLFCIKDRLKPGFHCKRQWFVERYKEGLRMNILKGSDGKMIGFIEYLPVEYAWRPISGSNFLFIHCMYIYPNKNKNQGFGSLLIKVAENHARENGMSGLCTVSSKGPWLADKRIFEKNGFATVGQKDRFELLCKKFTERDNVPTFIDWTPIQANYSGWNLLYADQCPWHEKAVMALQQTAAEHNIKLNIKKLKTVTEAKHGPSGYGVFGLLHNGKLLADHYISATRFKNILRKEQMVAQDKLGTKTV